MKKNILIVSLILILFVAIDVIAAPIIIRVGHANPPGEPNYEAFDKVFKPRLEELSEGRIEVQLYPSSQLGGERDLMEQVQMGTIEMCTAGGPLGTFSSVMDVFILPFLFEDGDHLWRVTDGEIGEKIAAQFEKDSKIKVIGWHSCGVRHMSNKMRPIWAPEDLEGLKIREFENDIALSFQEECGAIPTPLPYNELYSSLATGIVDGGPSDSTGYRGTKIYEVSPYYSLTGHHLFPKLVMINPAFFKKLPTDLQSILLDVMDETEAYHRELYETSFEKDIDYLLAQGVKINLVDKKPFQDVAQRVWDKYADRIGKDIIEEIQNMAQ